MAAFFAEAEFVVSSLEHRKQPERIRRKSSTSGKCLEDGGQVGGERRVRLRKVL
jgi:hypothetical protein